MTQECLCAGILVADHVCAPIPHLPAAGELVLTDKLVLNIGGCASNTAMDLARVGVQVSVAGCVGKDVFGQFVCDTLGAAGVATGCIRRLDHVGTSGTLVVNVAGEDRRFVHDVGANAHMTAADIPADQIERCKVLYVGGYLLMERLDPIELAAIFRRARAAGVTTVLDVVVPGPGNHLPLLAPLLPEADYFLPNSDEGKLLTGLADPVQQADRFVELGAKTVVITCGGEGTILVSDEERLKAGVYPIDFVDGSGAGDAFDAGFIAGLLAGESPQRCLEWGSALGAACVRSLGTTAGVFTRDEAIAFMREHSLPISPL